MFYDPVVVGPQILKAVYFLDDEKMTHSPDSSIVQWSWDLLVLTMGRQQQGLCIYTWHILLLLLLQRSIAQENKNIERPNNTFRYTFSGVGNCTCVCQIGILTREIWW